MSKIKNGGLDQYGTEPLELQQFGTASIEGVNDIVVKGHKRACAILRTFTAGDIHLLRSSSVKQAAPP